ncbi:MAG TPA: ScyD/ScyE family protein [Acidimicrobiales bacterium]|nr:ScyD/ScyE family protein [Acidimicrobiales bacterium]
MFERQKRRAFALGVAGISALSLMATTPALGAVSAKDAATGPAPTQPTVVAKDLNNPRKLTIGPDGSLYITEAGKGGPPGPDNSPPTGPDNCVSGPEGQACYGHTGSITKVTAGVQSRVLEGLPSAAGQDPGTEGWFAAGPAAVSVRGDGQLDVLLQTLIDQNGDNPFGDPFLGRLITAAPGSDSSTWRAIADFGKYEAEHNPDNGAGAASTGQAAIDSDPYALTPYLGGWAVADAAANDLLWTDANGNLALLAVFPIQQDSGGNDVQSVPTSVAVGPDGALYVGELAGFAPGMARIWRVVPGQPPEVVATGFTTITDLAFDRQGRIVVTEFTTDPANQSAPGAVIRLERDGSRTQLASDGLAAVTGLAVASDGSIYVSNFGIAPGDGAGPHGEVLRIPVAQTNPYRFVASDGGVFTFGDTGYYGSTGDLRLNKPVVGMASNPLRPGYWLVASDGGIFSFGDAEFHGSTGNITLNQPIVGMAPTPDGRGYWLVASDGGIFSFGDAEFHGSTGNITLNQPIVGMTATPDGRGYWLVASDGGIFAFGDAGFFGSTGNITLNKPIVGMTAAPDGMGYWMVASDGGIFNFGSAGFFGSAGDIKLNSPIVSMTTTTDGAGYTLVAADGGVFNYGNSTFHGSTGNIKLNKPIVGSDVG